MKRDNSSEESILDWPRRAGVAEQVFRAVEMDVRRRRRRIIQAVGGTAGLALLLLGVLWWAQRMPGSASPSSSIAISLPVRQVLPDGSVVELRDGAQISINYAGPLRRVRLQRGEAHFQVAKNPSRAFVVTAQGVEVRAVGTAFCVQMDLQGVGVLVTEGRVSVDRTPPTADPAGAPPRPLVFVNAGNRVVINAPSRAGPERVPEVQTVSPAVMDDLLAWRRLRLEFSGTPLSDAIQMLNRYGTEHLVLGDSSLGKLQLSGVLRADNTEALLRLLSSNFGIVAERQSGHEIVLRAAH